MTTAELPSSLASLPALHASPSSYSPKSSTKLLETALYRDISVTFRDAFGGPDSDDYDWEDIDYEPDMDETGGVAWDRAHITTDGDRIETTITRAPHLARLVEGITLDYLNMDFSARWLPRHFIRAMCAACPRLQRLRTFEADGLEVDALADILLQALPPLVEYEAVFLGSLPRLVHRLSSLRHLRLRRLTVEDNLGEAFTFPSTLLSLRLGGWIGPSFPSLPAVLKDLAPSLRSLHLEGSAVRRLGVHLTNFKALVHLTITDMDEEDLPLLHTILHFAASLEHLKSLRLAGEALLSLQTDRLPPQLQVIRVEEDLQPGGLASLLSDESRGVLRQVVVEKDWRRKEDWEKLGAEKGWQVERFGVKVVFAR
ncbi:hypothetical protein BCR35DRAFT_332311 [Leucosporidium creatinivorum]|uniref:Proteophosphoglycan ppg4 n=1 Tax=Leucosporidium creatinivorum TaxID=106004 RepID=A0A1Y2F3H5_9BASI|nr:hypothetical protein BCR35DRAFT_332311 [Leucosporidium creatinivorum]